MVLKDREDERPLTENGDGQESTEEMVADSYRSGVIEQEEMEPGEMD